MSTILQNHYVLAVHDARQLYVRMLGFRIMAEPDGGVFVAKNGGMILLGQHPDDMPLSARSCHNYFAYLSEITMAQ